MDAGETQVIAQIERRLSQGDGRLEKRLSQVEELVASLQQRLALLDKAELRPLEKELGANEEGKASTDLQARLESLEDALADRAFEQEQTRELLEEGLARERDARESNLQAISAEFQLNVSELLLQVERGLASVEESAVMQTKHMEAALAGLNKRVEDSIATGASELVNTALDSLVRQADAVVQRSLAAATAAAIATIANSASPSATIPSPPSGQAVVRQRSFTSAYGQSSAMSATIPASMSASSSSTAAIAVAGHMSMSPRALSPVTVGARQMLAPGVSMPILRPQMQPGLEPWPQQGPMIKATPRLQSRGAVPPQAFAGRCSSPEGVRMTMPSFEEAYGRGRSTEPLGSCRSPLVSRSPDFLRQPHAPTMMAAQRISGAISPSTTHRSLPRSPFGVLAPQSPRTTAVSEPGQWVKQPPAALRKPVPQPHR